MTQLSVAPMQDETTQLEAQIHKAFEEYARERMAGLRARRADVVSAGLYGEAEVDKYFEREQKLLASLDADTRAAILVNNFHMWWPRGWYRDLKMEGDPHKDAHNKKLIEDLDQFLSQQENTYEIERMAANDASIERTKRLHMLAKAYFYMLSKGYSREELTS